MSRYRYKKTYSWNPELAYIAGLVASDGCLYNDGRHISVTSLDIDLLELVIHLLDLKCAIGKKKSGYKGYGHYVQFSDVALYDFLMNAGITPAKSKTIPQLDIPDQFYADFLRGVFDGDGSIWGYWDTRWRSSLMYYTSYTSASRPFLEWLQTKNQELASTTPGSLAWAKHAYILRYAKEDSLKLFNFMYFSSTRMGLLRKYLKFVDFLTSDPYANRASVGASAGIR